MSKILLLISILLAGIILLCIYFFEQGRYKKGHLGDLLVGLFDIIYIIACIIAKGVIK